MTPSCPNRQAPADPASIEVVTDALRTLRTRLLPDVYKAGKLSRESEAR